MAKSSDPDSNPTPKARAKRTAGERPTGREVPPLAATETAKMSNAGERPTEREVPPPSATETAKMFSADASPKTEGSARDGPYTKWNRFYRKASQVYLSHLNGLSAGEAKIRAQVEYAYQRYLQEVSATGMELHERFMAAHKVHNERLSAAWGVSQFTERCGRDYENYVSTLNDLAAPGNDRQVRMENAYHAMLDDVENGFGKDQTGGAVEESFRGYVREIQKLLSQSTEYDRAVKRADLYLDSLKEVQDHGQARTTEAHEDYVASLQNEWNNAALNETLEAIFSRYNKVLEESWREARLLNEQLTKETAEKLEAAWNEFNR